jgi:hypothetical protein
VAGKLDCEVIGGQALKALGLSADVVGMDDFSARSERARAIMGALVTGSHMALGWDLPARRLALRANSASVLDIEVQARFTCGVATEAASGQGSPLKLHSSHVGPM